MIKSALLNNVLVRVANIRLLRNVQTQSSYLKNPGSEPLQHVSLGQVLGDVVQKYPGRIAVKSMHENLTLTYEELLTQADALAYALLQQGFQKNDRLGIWSHNTAAWVVAVLAAARVGLISVLINPVYEKSELSFCLNKVQLKGIVVPDALKNRDYYSTLHQLIPELHKSKPGELKSDVFPSLTSIITSSNKDLPGTLRLDSLVSSYKNNDVSKCLNEVKYTDGAIIHFTSGSTGQPKAALNSHLGIVNNIYFSGKRNSFHEEHHNICVQVPLFHALGSIVTVLGGLRHGCTLVFAAPTYDVQANINTLCGEKCSIVTGTPTMYVDILSRIKGQVLPAQIKVALAAGAPCSPEIIRQIKTTLNAESVRALYGLTETTASVFQSVEGDSVEVTAETVGYIQEHVEVKVVDSNGNIVPFGSPGELLSRGYNNMIGYWDDPEKTKKTLSEDGWLSTGDVFIIAPDGYGKIVGRLKDIIVRGGENIAPKEIEDLLNTHPDIVESQVIGVKDDRLGEELCAVVRLRENATMNQQDIKEFCSGRIARFKIPKILKLTDTFPKTASGKIQKFKIREMVESGKM